MIICDLNFPSKNWGAFSSNDKEEQDVFNILEESLLRQAIDFPICGKNILDELLYQKCEVFSQNDTSFKGLYDCTAHLPVVSFVEIDYQLDQRAKERYYTFTKAHVNSML